MPEKKICFVKLRNYKYRTVREYTEQIGIASDENIQLKIFDLTGKLLSTGEFLNQSYTFRTVIDLSDHAPGMYQIHIKTDHALLQRVLIKQ